MLRSPGDAGSTDVKVAVEVAEQNNLCNFSCWWCRHSTHFDLSLPKWICRRLLPMEQLNRALGFQGILYEKSSHQRTAAFPSRVFCMWYNIFNTWQRETPIWLLLAKYLRLWRKYPKWSAVAVFGNASVQVVKMLYRKKRKQYRLHNSGNILFLQRRKVPYKSQTLILNFWCSLTGCNFLFQISKTRWSGIKKSHCS